MRAPQINHEQAKLLARFVNAIRPDWDVAGVEHYIGQARGLAPAAEVACAAIRAATVAGNRTPAVIPLPGAHWRPVTDEPVFRRPSRDELCRECGKDEATCKELGRRLVHMHGHEFTPLSVPVTTGELRPRSGATTADYAAARAARANQTPTPTPEPVTSTQGATT